MAMAMAADDKEGSSQVDLEQGPREIVFALRRKIDKLPQVSKRKNSRQPFIWRVPSYLRNIDPEAYEPKIVSIGPLHRRKEELQPMEEVKLETLRDILDSQPANTLDIFFEEVFDCLDQARDEYAEKLKLSDDEFAEMLVIDGCFIIGFFLGLIFKSN